MALASSSSIGSAFSSACNDVYGNPQSRLMQHINGAGISFAVPTLQSFQAKADGLAEALKLFPGTFSSNTDLASFVANVVWESLCLTAKEEVACLKDPVKCREQYGGEFWYVLSSERSGPSVGARLHPNYRSLQLPRFFANAINNQAILSNPSLVSTDETLSWASAVWYWNARCRQSSSNVGQALQCVNSPECNSGTSSTYFQFAPPYRLQLAKDVSKSFGVDPREGDSIGQCPQMGVALDTAWSQFCRYHGDSASVTCRNPPPSTNSTGTPTAPRSTGTVGTTASIASVSVQTATGQPTSTPIAGSKTPSDAQTLLSSYGASRTRSPSKRLPLHLMLDNLRLDDRLQTFVTRYVWDLALDPQKREEVVRVIQKGKPFVETEYMAIAMIDVSDNQPLDFNTLSKAGVTINNTYQSRGIDAGNPHLGYHSDSNDLCLGVHLAVSTGDVDRRIFGIDSSRLDYNLSGSCFRVLGVLLDSTVSGELGIAAEFIPDKLKSLGTSLGNEEYLIIKSGSIASATDYFFEYYNPESIHCHAASVSSKQDTEKTSVVVTEALQFASLFVNKSLLYKLFSSAQSEWKESKKETEDNSSKSQHMTREFRKVTVIFVSLLPGMDAPTLNRLCSDFIQEVEKRRGIFQQFSSDDKGMSLMAVFGLPPWSFEKNAAHALKTIRAFSEKLQQRNLPPLPISAATGELLYSVLGNDIRRDAGLLGDVVNLAARLLSISYRTQQIVCDTATFETAKEDIRMVDLGDFKVKGKVDRVNVYGLNYNATNTTVKVQQRVTKSVGYNTEKDLIMESYQEWKRTRGKWIAICEGASGFGKSNMLEFVSSYFESDKVQCCLTQGSEIERWTPFFGVQAIYQSFLMYVNNKRSESDQHHTRSSTTLGTDGGWSRIHLRRRTSASHASAMDIQCRADSKNVLLEIEEDLDYHPILLHVFGSGKVVETSKTEGLDSQTRNALLKRFMLKMVQVLSQNHQIVFVFDDSQWLDPASLDILLQLSQESYGVAIFFLTRPIADVEVDYMLKISKIPRILHIKLNGFSQKEVDELILLKLEKFGAQKVESLLSRTIYEHTHGHPLKVDLLIGAVFSESDNSCLELCPSGELRAKNVGTISNSLNQLELSDAALVQFDRLDDSFKNFLRKASIFGQYFSTDSVTSVFGLTFGKDHDVKDWIQQMDKYGFLLSHEKDTANVSDYYFKHISVMQCIYDTQPYEERSRQHHQVAEFYESICAGHDMDALLPIIAYHYSKTTNMKKNFLYLESLGYMNFRKVHYRECQSALELLCSYVDQTESTFKVETTRKADWLAHLVFVLAALRQMQNVVPLGLKALQMTGISIPLDDKKQATKALLRAVAELTYNWIKTKGGMKPFMVKGKAVGYLAAGEIGHNSGNESGACNAGCVDCPKVRRIRTLCFKALTMVAFTSGAMPANITNLLLLGGLNADIKSGAVDSGEWVVTAMRVVHGLYPKMPLVGDLFLERSTAIERQRSLYGKTCLAYIGAATIYFSRMEFEKAGNLSQQALKLWQGDVEGSMTVLEGKYDKAAFKINPVFAMFSLIMAARPSFLSGNIPELQKHLDVFTFFMTNMPKIPAVVCYNTAGDCIKCYLAYHQGFYAEAWEKLLSAIKHLASAPNIGYPSQESIMLYSVFVWLLISTIDKSTSNGPPVDRRTMIATCQSGHAYSTGIHKKAKVFSFQWAARLFKSALLFVHGKKAKALHLLVDCCENRHLVHELDMVPLLRAHVHGIVGKFLGGGPSAQKSKEVWAKVVETCVSTWEAQRAASSSTNSSNNSKSDTISRLNIAPGAELTTIAATRRFTFLIEECKPLDENSRRQRGGTDEEFEQRDRLILEALQLMARWEALHPRKVDSRQLSLKEQVIFGIEKKRSLLGLNGNEAALQPKLPGSVNLMLGPDNDEVSDPKRLKLSITETAESASSKFVKSEQQVAELCLEDALRALTPQQKKMLMVWPPTFGWHGVLARVLVHRSLQGLEQGFPCLNLEVSTEAAQKVWLSGAEGGWKRTKLDKKREVMRLVQLVGKNMAADHYGLPKWQLGKWIKEVEEEQQNADSNPAQTGSTSADNSATGTADSNVNTKSDGDSRNDASFQPESLTDQQRDFVINAFNQPGQCLRYIPPKVNLVLHPTKLELSDKNVPKTQSDPLSSMSNNTLAAISPEATLNQKTTAPFVNFSTTPSVLSNTVFNSIPPVLTPSLTTQTSVLSAQQPILSAPLPQSFHSQPHETPPHSTSTHTTTTPYIRTGGSVRTAYTYLQKLEAVQLGRKIGRNKAARFYGISAPLLGKWMKTLEDLADMTSLLTPTSSTTASEGAGKNVDEAGNAALLGLPKKLLGQCRNTTKKKGADGRVLMDLSLGKATGAIGGGGNDWYVEEETQLANFIRIWRAGGFVVSHKAIRRWMTEAVRNKQQKKSSSSSSSVSLPLLTMESGGGHGVDNASLLGSSSTMEAFTGVSNIAQNDASLTALLQEALNSSEFPQDNMVLNPQSLNNRSTDGHDLSQNNLSDFRASITWLLSFLERHKFRRGLDTFGPLGSPSGVEDLDIPPQTLHDGLGDFGGADGESGEGSNVFADEEVMEESKYLELKNSAGMGVGQVHNGGHGDKSRVGRPKTGAKKSMAELWSKTVAKLSNGGVGVGVGVGIGGDGDGGGGGGAAAAAGAMNDEGYGQLVESLGLSQDSRAFLKSLSANGGSTNGSSGALSMGRVRQSDPATLYHPHAAQTGMDDQQKVPLNDLDKISIHVDTNLQKESNFNGVESDADAPGQIEALSDDIDGSSNSSDGEKESEWRPASSNRPSSREKITAPSLPRRFLGKDGRMQSLSNLPIGSNKPARSYSLFKSKSLSRVSKPALTSPTLASSMSLTGQTTSENFLPATGTQDKFQENKILFDGLDPTATAVKTTKDLEKPLGIINHHPKLRSYQDVRLTYQLEREAMREHPFTAQSNLFWRNIGRAVSRLVSILLETFPGSSIVIAFILLDLITDLIFCAQYLSEAHYNILKEDNFPELQNKEPRWLWTYRSRQMFIVNVAFSVLNIFSFCVRVLFADNKFRVVFDWKAFIDLFTVVPFIVALGIPGGQYLYVPYFLRIILVLSRLKSVLRLRGSARILRLSILTEKLTLVIASVLCIVYCGICVIQYVEFIHWQNGGSERNEIKRMMIDYFYFVVIVFSTVGFGDITPHSTTGKLIVIVMIVIALAVVPSLITSFISTAALQRAGGGQYSRGLGKFVVVIGSVDRLAIIADLMETFLDTDDGDEAMQLVVMAPHSAPTDVKAVISQSLYKDRVTYLVGNGLDPTDFKRCQIEYASAVYIIADRNAASYRLEDERNTLRAWSIHEYAPQVPIFVSNLLTDTEHYQEGTIKSSVCVDDLKQILLSQTTLYPGSATLLINLLHSNTPADQYDEPWQAQYGDGVGNELYSVVTNLSFVGKTFTEIAWYLYEEFQVILVGIRTVLTEGQHLENHHLLNPGDKYTIQQDDILCIVAQTRKEIHHIENLTRLHFEHSFHTKPANNGEKKKDKVLARSPMAKSISDTKDVKLCKRLTVLGRPKGGDMEGRTPTLCQLRSSKATIEECTREDLTTMEDHILICTSMFNVAKFVMSIRASHRVDKEYKTLVFLCTRLPTTDEFKPLDLFPDILFVVGDPRRKSDLIRAGIHGATDVVLLGLSGPGMHEFLDTGALMVSHLIYTIFKQLGKKKRVILDLSRRNSINFLRPRRKTKTTANKQTALVSAVLHEGLDYLSAPTYAAGRVIVATMLDCMLYHLNKNEPLLTMFKLFCGVRTRRQVRMDKSLKVEPSFLTQIPVPAEFVVSAARSFETSLL
ncbi:potassium channel, sub T, member 1 [Chytridiales sp. JEL 0842]|nr:potassium channel, sub T, member 1 [Chytridiales sp. JEL 0842]